MTCLKLREQEMKLQVKILEADKRLLNLNWRTRITGENEFMVAMESCTPIFEYMDLAMVLDLRKLAFDNRSYIRDEDLGGFCD